MRNIAVYRLKITHGKPITIRFPVGSDVNLNTGARDTDFEDLNIKAVPMPADRTRSFFKELAHIMSGARNAYPFDKATRDFLVEVADLKGNSLTQDCQILYAGKAYEVKAIEDVVELGAMRVTCAASEASTDE